MNQYRGRPDSGPPTWEHSRAPTTCAPPIRPTTPDHVHSYSTFSHQANWTVITTVNLIMNHHQTHTPTKHNHASRPQDTATTLYRGKLTDTHQETFISKKGQDQCISTTTKRWHKFNTSEISILLKITNIIYISILYSYIFIFLFFQRNKVNFP